MKIQLYLWKNLDFFLKNVKLHCCIRSSLNVFSVDVDISSFSNWFLSSLAVGRFNWLFDEIFCFVVVEELELPIGPFEVWFGNDKRLELDGTDAT